MDFKKISKHRFSLNLRLPAFSSFAVFALCVLLTSCSSNAQDDIVINGHLKGNTRFAKVVVGKFQVGRVDVASTAIKDERFSLTVPADIEPGVYRFVYSQTTQGDFVDIIIDGKEKNITFELDVTEPGKLPVFSTSNENKNWNEYLAKEGKHLNKINVLNHVLANYPDKKDPIVEQTTKAVTQLKSDFEKNFDRFCNANKNTWAGAMVQNRPYYFTNPTDHQRLQAYELKDNFWNNIDTSSPELINTPLYTDHILNYLRYYMNPEMQFTTTEMTDGFIKSVDVIMEKFGKNDITNKFAIQYLQEGFKVIDNEKVLQHIDQNYAASILQGDSGGDVQNEAFEKRMAGYAALKPGEMAPAINFEVDGKKQTLTSITSDYTVVVFWATWCSYCVESLPKLNEWLKDHPQVKVLAISLDENKSDYENAVLSLGNMMHYSDFKKWDGAAVSDYYVYGTPTLILLDKDKKIIDKFSNEEGLFEYFK